MSSDKLRCQVGAEDPKKDIAAAFQRAEDQQARALTLVLDPAVRPTAELADAFLEIAPGHGVVELYLVHPSPSIGFVASSLQLRMRNIVVRGTRAASEPPASSADSRVRSRYAIVAVDGDIDGEELGRRLLRVSSAKSIAIVFAGEQRPPRQLVDAIAAVLPQMKSLEQLLLVHPSPSVGFFASSLSLRAPQIELRALRSLDELEGVG